MTRKRAHALRRVARRTTGNPQRCEPSTPIRETPGNSSTPLAHEEQPGERGLLRPGYDVRVGEYSSNAMRVTSATRLKPGMRTELHLLDQRRILRGELDHCRVSRLEPLRYEAIFVFHQSIDMPETSHA